MAGERRNAGGGEGARELRDGSVVPSVAEGGSLDAGACQLTLEGRATASVSSKIMIINLTEKTSFFFSIYFFLGCRPQHQFVLPSPCGLTLR